MPLTKSIWSPCREYPDVKHNHVLCECPSCTDVVVDVASKDAFYKCVLSLRYLTRDPNKTIPEMIEDQPWL